jgi:hypothetical protein
MRGDQGHTLGKGEIKLPDDLQALVNRVFVAQINERPIVRIVVDQVDAATNASASLVIQLDDVREQWLTLDYGHATFWKNRSLEQVCFKVG